VCLIVLVALLAACSLGRDSADAAPTAAPTSSTSRTARSETVEVNETLAKTDVVTAQTNHPAPAAQSGDEADTPATGDFPVLYFTGVLGLILLCSAGLLMLRRI